MGNRAPSVAISRVASRSETKLTKGFRLSKLTRDRKMKDENGKDVDLKTGDIIQTSVVVPGRWWRVVQTKDTVTPARATTANSRATQKQFRKTTKPGAACRRRQTTAHSDDSMTCFACHSSWMTSCFGCHLRWRLIARCPIATTRAAIRATSRNTTSGTPRRYFRCSVATVQLRATRSRRSDRHPPYWSVRVIRIASGSNSQQQTISAEGFSGQTFNSHVPHTVRGKETKQCTDCHISEKNDNNAWLAQLLYREPTLSILWALRLRCR